MHMLVTLIFITAAYMRNIARASDVCGKPEHAENTVPVTDLSFKINATVRIQCVKGYVRKAGTSSLIKCLARQNDTPVWHTELPLKCIRDPRIPPVTTTDPKSPPVTTTVAETQSPHQQHTLCTTKTTAKNNPTPQGTSLQTAATGHIALTPTNEVVTTKTRRITSQPTLMSSRKVSIATTTETATSYTSRKYMTTTSTHMVSDSLTTTREVNASVTTSNTAAGSDTAKHTGFTPAVGGATCTVLILLMVPAVFLFIWCKSHRNHPVSHPIPDPPDSCVPLTVCGPELSSAQSKETAENCKDVSVIYKNPGIPHDADTCEELLPHTDS